MRKLAIFVIPFLLILLAARSAMAELRSINTPHYLVQTDLDDQFAHELCDRLEAMYGQYSHRLAAFERRASAVGRMEVYLFRDQRDYGRLTGGKIKNSGGIFLPNRNLLAAFLGGQGRQQLRRTLQHEAFHQFAYNAISANLPIWLSEGLAQFFEEGLWKGENFELGEVPPRRVRQLQADLKADRLLPFSMLLPMSDGQWARRLSINADQGAVQYNQSWAMVHFLVMGQNSHGEFLYRPHLLAMLRLLHDGKTPAQAFQLAFGSNVAAFQARFLEYARSLQAGSEATLLENQGVLADLLSGLAQQGKRFEDMETFRKFVTRRHLKLHYHMGNLQWDTQDDPGGYFSDLTGGRFSSDDLFFSTHGGAPLPDIVCRSGGQILRTRFYDAGPRAIDHDLLIEPSHVTVSITP